jgi:hypothetical protein
LGRCRKLGQREGDRFENMSRIWLHSESFGCSRIAMEWGMKDPQTQMH